MKKNKLLFYNPGMISLIVLPVLLFPFLLIVTPYGNLRMLEIIAVREKAPERNFLEIMLTGNEYSDKIKLDFAQVMMKEIEANQDTVRGIHYKFGPTSNYKSFVRIISDSELLNQPYYLFNGHELWSFYFRPPERELIQESFVCGTRSHCVVLNSSESTPYFEKLLSTDQSVIMMCSFAFLVITTFSSKMRMKRSL